MPLTTEQARKNGKAGGRPKGQVSKTTLAAMKVREILVKTVMASAVPLAKKMVEKGLTGDVQALNSCWDRVIGKPIESINLTGDVSLKLDLF